MSAAQRQIEIDDPSEVIDEIAAAVAWHDGDAQATIRTLLADCQLSSPTVGTGHDLDEPRLFPRLAAVTGPGGGWAMSDEPDAAATGKGVGPYVHYCRHPGCRKWGGFGFAVGKGEPQWFCFEHRPEVWPPAKQAA